MHTPRQLTKDNKKFNPQTSQHSEILYKKYLRLGNTEAMAFKLAKKEYDDGRKPFFFGI